MSIASEITRIKNNISAAYDEAEAKGATMPATENSANLADTVASIPEAVQPTLITKQITANDTYSAEEDNADGYDVVVVDVPIPAIEKDVNFYDYNGDLLYSYTKAEAALLEELPALPSHEGLIAQSWTHTLAQLKTFAESTRSFIEVGATYITDDSSIRLYFEFVGEEAVNISIPFYISGVLSLEIDWGDGSSVETITSSTTVSHSFSAALFTSLVMMKATPHGSGSFNILLNNSSVQNAVVRIEIGSNYPTLVNNQFDHCKHLKHITLPQGINSVGSSAFFNCLNLKACILPLGTETIYDNAFTSCYNINRIIMPESLITIGAYVFQNNYSLLSLVIPPNIFAVKNTMIRQNYSLKRISLPNITQIENQGISSNPCLDFMLPRSLEQIGQYGCSYNGITRLDLPSGITNISNYAFYNNERLQVVNIPDTVTSIGNNAFLSCISLLYIVIPNSVKSIGSAAFYLCNSLLTIDISEYTDPTDLPTLVNYNAFPQNNGMKIYVANQAMLNAFSAATNWSRFSAYYRLKGA